MPANTPSMWTAAAVEELRRLAAEGMSAAQIAAALECSRNALLGKAARLSIPLKGGSGDRAVRQKIHNRMSDGVRQAARKLWDDGHTQAEIAEKLQIGRTSIGTWAKNERWPKRIILAPAAKPAPERKAVIVVARPEPAPIPAPASDGIGIMALSWRTCRWPITTWPRGMGEDALYCGGPAQGRYCARHQRMARKVAA